MAIVVIMLQNKISEILEIGELLLRAAAFPKPEKPFDKEVCEWLAIAILNGVFHWPSIIKRCVSSYCFWQVPPSF